MNLTSISLIERKARELIRAYVETTESIEAKIGKPNRPPKLITLGNVLSDVRSLRARSEEIAADPEFDTLPSELRSDIAAISQEWAVLEEEIAFAVDPEEEWKSMGQQEKNDATAGRFAGAEQLDVIRNRMKLNLRDQNEGPIKRPKGGGQP